jgi:hypothetical protein
MHISSTSVVQNESQLHLPIAAEVKNLPKNLIIYS